MDAPPPRASCSLPGNFYHLKDRDADIGMRVGLSSMGGRRGSAANMWTVGCNVRRVAGCIAAWPMDGWRMDVAHASLSEHPRLREHSLRCLLVQRIQRVGRQGAGAGLRGGQASSSCLLLSLSSSSTFSNLQYLRNC